MFRLYVLGSGSTGNALLVQTSRSRVIVDCGLTARELARRMVAAGAGSPDGADAIVVTHCHGDHASGVPVTSTRHKVPVYMAPGTKRWYANRKRHEEVLFHPGGSFEVGDLTIRTIPLSHDAPDTVALRFEHGDRTLGICTDLGEATAEVERGLAGCGSLFLESNHDVEMLVNGPYPARLKKRILGRWGHISNEQSSDLLSKLIPAGARHVILAHLSETNNTPAKALEAMRGLRDRHSEVLWSVASPTVPAVYDIEEPAASAPAVLSAERQLELL